MQRLTDDEALVPQLWNLEIRNILAVNERRRRIEPGDSNAFLQDLSLLPIRVHPDTDEGAALMLARKHQLTVYDATYLHLAVRLSAPLATLDRSLARAAQAEGLQVIAA